MINFFLDITEYGKDSIDKDCKSYQPANTQRDIVTLKYCVNTLGTSINNAISEVQNSVKPLEQRITDLEQSLQSVKEKLGH